MRIVFMCDLHLPKERQALQYNVLDWAVSEILKNKPDCIVFAGDITCDGDVNVYCEAIEKINETGLPFLYIPGNSDLRCEKSASILYQMASPSRTVIDGVEIIALNDCDRKIREDQYLILDKIGDKSIVFMHHPISALEVEHQEKMQAWMTRFPQVPVFYGHLHKDIFQGNCVGLRALDPDKTIGGSPVITFYDTEKECLEQMIYKCPVPEDLYEYFGVSCRQVEREIQFAIKNRLKYLELRWDVLSFDFMKLKQLIGAWRNFGGENLSLHLPDVQYKNGELIPDPGYDELIDLAKKLHVDRFTQHVPKITVREAREQTGALETIADYMAERFNGFENQIVVGIENMHMKSKEKPDESRRFGYIPEECIEFMQILQSKCKHKVGINFDIGHARNNKPFSQSYQTSTWFALLGKHIVGYHIHQVISENGTFSNHVAITSVYDKVLSFASLFKCWKEGIINKAPFVFEMRPEGAYDTTLETFEYYRKKNDV
ncbi:MAG: metallophosphoesterase [Lachnospiraceae bacterium]|nr:metallophosphoesterase [Lachnospiraceae bacterium]